MKRHGTQGKIVKHVTLSVTQTDLAQVSTKIAIRFSTDGWFRIDLPEHITAWFKGRTLPFENAGKLDYHDGEISAKTLQEVETALTSALVLYKSELKDHERVKKLVVTFRADYRGPRRIGGGVAVDSTSLDRIASIGFEGGKGPALGIAHEVLWQIGDGLYRVYPSHTEGQPPQMTRMRQVPKPPAERPPNAPHMRSYGGGESTFLLDWTEEREAFFANAVENMNVLIERIATMLLGDVETTVDRLIAGGGGMLSLPAPQEKLTDDA